MTGRLQCLAVFFGVLLATPPLLAQVQSFPEHGFSVNIPAAWRRMEALSGNTILKLQHGNSDGSEARIAITANAVDPKLDLATISREALVASLEAGTIVGERVSVIDAGHAEIAGTHALWGKTYRNLPSRGVTYEYSYELVRVKGGMAKGFTVRLTSYGSAQWFESNSAVLEQFMQSLRFTDKTSPQGESQATSGRSLARNQNRNRGENSAKQTSVQFRTVESPWRSFAIACGKTFLMFLAASTLAGIVHWLYRTFSSQDRDGETPPE